jgi:hypothetical protein
MVFTCWDQYFDGIHRLLTHENKKIAMKLDLLS